MAEAVESVGMQEWYHALVERRGVSAVAKELDLPPATLEMALDARHTSFGALLRRLQHYRARTEEGRRPTAGKDGETLMTEYREGRWDFSGQDFGGKDLHGVWMPGANFARCNFEEANLRDAWLLGADLTLAFMERACLDGANLSLGKLLGAVLSGASMRRTGVAAANLRHATLEGADLREACLAGSILEGTKLKDTQLDGADLIRAVLRGAFIDGARLAGARLGGAILPEGFQIEGVGEDDEQTQDDSQRRGSEHGDAGCSRAV